jgi:hypothetical protein
VAVLGVACTLVLAWVVCTVIPLFARFAVVGSKIVWRTRTRVLATSLVFTDCEVMAVILCRAAHWGFCLTPTTLPPLLTRTNVSTRLVLANCFVQTWVLCTFVGVRFTVGSRVSTRTAARVLIIVPPGLAGATPLARHRCADAEH